jgi:hypothetical protein
MGYNRVRVRVRKIWFLGTNSGKFLVFRDQLVSFLGPAQDTRFYHGRVKGLSTGTESALCDKYPDLKAFGDDVQRLALRQGKQASMDPGGIDVAVAS